MAQGAGQSPRRRAGWGNPARTRESQFQSKLFTAAGDHRATLGVLRELHARLLLQAETKSGREFRLAVAALEERGVEAFERLGELVQSDGNLFDTTERPELLAEVGTAKEKFLEGLGASAAARELPPLPAKYTAAEIDAAFAPYLRKNPLMMDLGGAVLVELAPTRWAVVGVAKTVLKDDSPQELLRAERVCALKAKAAIVAERDGSQVTYLKRVRDTPEVVEGGATAKSFSERTKLTEERAAGVVRSLAAVGRWRSEGGKVSYLAVGGVVDRDAAK